MNRQTLENWSQEAQKSLPVGNEGVILRAAEMLRFHDLFAENQSQRSQRLGGDGGKLRSINHG